jgi:hypothetical protein
MPIRKRGAGIAFTLFLSSSVGAVEFDVFGRVLAEHNMIPVNSNVCSTKAEIDVPPQLLQGVRPLFPVDSVLSRNSGGATIRYRVGVDGKTTVLSSDTKGPAEARKWFGNHAIMAVGSWTFTPGQRAGEPVPVDCAIAFRFGAD